MCRYVACRDRQPVSATATVTVASPRKVKLGDAEMSLTAATRQGPAARLQRSAESALGVSGKVASRYV
ncbi:MAG: hypothetical protein LW850_23160 [Planctomycetaceae bacterium]|nr:hypothetical protein [Planctomycetaceae bacterium]